MRRKSRNKAFKAFSKILMYDQGSASLSSHPYVPYETMDLVKNNLHHGQSGKILLLAYRPAGA